MDDYTLVLTATGGRIHASIDGTLTLCGHQVDEHRGTYFWGSVPDCPRCRKAVKA